MPVQIRIDKFKIVFVVQFAHRKVQFCPCQTVKKLVAYLMVGVLMDLTFVPYKPGVRTKKVGLRLDRLGPCCLASAQVRK